MLKFGSDNEIITEEKCRAILVGVRHGKNDERSMEELEGLAEDRRGKMGPTHWNNKLMINWWLFTGEDGVRTI